MCFNVSITKDTGQYLATFNHVGYLFYAKLSDKESETLLVCTDKVMIVEVKNLRCSYFIFFE